ncbi:MAG TPA: cytochrome c [Gemmatimonadaceae bacterium]|jgi:mono/diheme cytochrome c family protein
MRSSLKRLLSLLVPTAIIPLVAASSHVSPRGPFAKTTWDSVYSPAQAGRGESSYAKTCARCHGAALSGGDEATPLVGSAFLGNWSGQTVADLQKRVVETMPSDTVGVYDKKLITDVIAFMLKANGFPAGSAELSVEADTLKAITITADKKTH